MTNKLTLPEVDFEQAFGISPASPEATAGLLTGEALELAQLERYPDFCRELLRGFKPYAMTEVRLEFATSAIATSARLRLYNVLRYIERHGGGYPVLLPKARRIKLRVEGNVLIAYEQKPLAWESPVSITTTYGGGQP